MATERGERCIPTTPLRGSSGVHMRQPIVGRIKDQDAVSVAWDGIQHAFQGF